MLVIRQEQLQVFLEYLMEDFVSRMAAALGAEFPAAHGAFTPAERKIHVRAAIAEARRWELQSNQDIEDFIRVGAALGIDFRRDPVNWSAEAAALLGDRGLSPGVRLHKLQAMTTLSEGGGTHRL